MEGLIPYIEEGICLVIAISLLAAAASPTLVRLTDSGQKALVALMRYCTAWRKK